MLHSVIVTLLGTSVSGDWGLAGVGINSPPLLFDSYATFDLPPAVQGQPTSECMPIEFWGCFCRILNNALWSLDIIGWHQQRCLTGHMVSHSFTKQCPNQTTSNNQWAFAHPPWQFLGPHHMHPTLSGDETPSALTKHHSFEMMSARSDDSAVWCCMCVSFSKGNFGCLQKISIKWEFGWSSHCDWSFTAVHEPMQGGTLYFSSLDNIQCRSMQKESNRTLLKPTLETGLDQNKDQPFQLINETCFHFPRWFISANTRQLQKQQETRPLLSGNCAHKTATLCSQNLSQICRTFLQQKLNHLGLRICWRSHNLQWQNVTPFTEGSLLKWKRAERSESFGKQTSLANQSVSHREVIGF